jgi:hypothetical protein
MLDYGRVVGQPGWAVPEYPDFSDPWGVPSKASERISKLLIRMRAVTKGVDNVHGFGQ